MLIRIVRMHFTETGVEKFLTVFQDHKLAILNSPGCIHLELLKDPDNSHTYTTLSHWQDSSCLENYRKSELFAAVWKKVKPFFSERAEAFSLEQFIHV